MAGNSNPADATRAVEKAVSEFARNANLDKSYAPPAQRGIHELVEEVEGMIETLGERISAIRSRLAEFDSLQSRFYNGRDV